MSVYAFRSLLVLWGGLTNGILVGIACSRVGIGINVAAALALLASVLFGALFQAYERLVRHEERAGRRQITWDIPADVTGEIRGISLLLDPQSEESDAGLPSQEVH